MRICPCETCKCARILNVSEVRFVRSRVFGELDQKTDYKLSSTGLQLVDISFIVKPSFLQLKRNVKI
jgi:hypothetical protein